jgi:large subunit ribosomal protein L17
MRHRKSGLKLGKTTSHRQSMFKNMVTSLFKYDRIRTTDVKAKELRRWVDHVITLAKRGDLHARRQVMNIVRDKNLVHELFETAAVKYSNRSSGYTRIVKIGRRPGDAAPLSLIELIDSENAPKKSRKTKQKATTAPTPPSPSVEPVVKEETKSSEEEAKEPILESKPSEETEETQPSAAPPIEEPTKEKQETLKSSNDESKEGDAKTDEPSLEETKTSDPGENDQTT